MNQPPPTACPGQEPWQQKLRRVWVCTLVCVLALVALLGGLLSHPSTADSPARRLKNCIFGPRVTERVEPAVRAPAAPPRHPTAQPDQQDGGGLPTPRSPATNAPPPLSGAPLTGRTNPASAPTNPVPAHRTEPESAAGTWGSVNSLGRVRSTGSGFFITADGYLLTCLHVVSGPGRVVVRTEAGSLAAQVIQRDAVNDVAVLKVAGRFKPLALAPSRTVKLGEAVFTIGFPNTLVQGLEPKFTRGEINSLAGILDDPRFFQTSVAVQPGNSGGPLVNVAGSVVGLITMRLDDWQVWRTTGSLPQNVNYALKSARVLEALTTLPQVTAQLRPPQGAQARQFEDVVKGTQDALALILVY
jgi:S1-C subfamily serine protease